MKKSVLILSLLAISLAACSKPKTEDKAANPTAASEIAASQPASATSETPTTTTGDNAQTSLDWAGTYKGEMPCADCSGIKTELELKDDKTFTIKREYLGKKGNDNKLEQKGSFTFDTKNPSIIALSAPEDRKIFIGENYVEFLDADGNKITGPLADLNKLKKD